MAMVAAVDGGGGLGPKLQHSIIINRSQNSSPSSCPKAIETVSPLHSRSLLCFPRRRKALVRCCDRDRFSVAEKKAKQLSPPSELRIPLESANESMELKAETGRTASVSGVFDEQRRTPDGGSPEVIQRRVGPVELLNAATKAIEQRNFGELALYGGMATAALFISGSLLSSLDVFPVVPEAMQTIGVIYSVLIASWLLQGKPASSVPSSPIRAVIGLVDGKKSKFQKTTVVLPEDLDNDVVAVVERLAKERDDAVNQMADMQRATEEYARVVAEKEALEAVAMQLAAEREDAMSEVSALKHAVDAMTNRMSAIEKMLEQEVEKLKQQNHALESVALQLAAERDYAVKEVEALRKDAALATRSMEEKVALEEVVSQLAQERDAALLEIENMNRMMVNLQTGTSTSSGLTLEQEVFIKARFHAVRSQFIDIHKGYEDQREQVNRFVSHLAEEYGAPRDWTLDYVKQIFGLSTTKKGYFGPESLNQCDLKSQNSEGNDVK